MHYTVGYITVGFVIDFSELFHLDRRKDGSVWDKSRRIIMCGVENESGLGALGESTELAQLAIKGVFGRLLPHARGLRFESLRGGFPSRWESVGFCPIDASIRGWQGLPSGWTLGGDGEFAVKELARLIKEKVLRVENDGNETLWNNLVPKKVNVFVRRALRGRLPVRVELDKRDMDLDSVLCPCCNDIVETCPHSLVTCDLAISVWIKVLNWLKVGNVNSFNIEEVFSHSGGVIIPIFLSHV
nr:RNA-directed DNA polymerase, eukaryota [Tanacetum cinerariifolium]